MDNLSIGFSRVNISPMMGTEIAGDQQRRIAEGVLDEPELNVLELCCGNKKAVIVSADLNL